ncbi:hypothetical protein F4703DRAFT_1933323 [Phycomyces blakesleeanus]
MIGEQKFHKERNFQDGAQLISKDNKYNNDNDIKNSNKNSNNSKGNSRMKKKPQIKRLEEPGELDKTN